MGWTFYERAKGQSNLEHFRQNFDSDRGRVLDCATVAGTAYIAYCVQPKGEPSYVTALVVLTRWNPRDEAGFNFGYKAIDESCGPNEDRCPQRILDQLSSLEDCGYEGASLEWARSWRARCNAYQNGRRSKHGIKHGSLVRFAEPIRFLDGSELSLLRWTGKGSKFSDPQTGRLYRITSWRDRQFAVEAPATLALAA